MSTLSRIPWSKIATNYADTIAYEQKQSLRPVESTEVVRFGDLWPVHITTVFDRLAERIPHHHLN